MSAKGKRHPGQEKVVDIGLIIKFELFAVDVWLDYINAPRVVEIGLRAVCKRTGCYTHNLSKFIY